MAAAIFVTPCFGAAPVTRLAKELPKPDSDTQRRVGSQILDDLTAGYESCAALTIHFAGV
jgi:hypothetical protein